MSKKIYEKQISEGNLTNIYEYLLEEYEDIKELMVDLIDHDLIKKTQGKAQYLRDLLKLLKSK